jgi:hypothetical protein
MSTPIRVARFSCVTTMPWRAVTGSMRTGGAPVLGAVALWLKASAGANAAASSRLAPRARRVRRKVGSVMIALYHTEPFCPAV